MGTVKLNLGGDIYNKEVHKSRYQAEIHKIDDDDVTCKFLDGFINLTWDQYAIFRKGNYTHE